jgi:nicotinamide-nucleotide amidase
MSGPSGTLSPALPGDIERLAVDVLTSTTKKDFKIATAESCTGGLLASLLTDVEGCGHCFDRGFVTYTNNSKADLLGIPSDILQQDGAVSRRAAKAMLQGALERSLADVAVAITGYAGRGGPGEEPGLVYIAAGRRGQSPQVREHHFGDRGRAEVRLHCLRAALKLLHEIL